MEGGTASGGGMSMNVLFCNWRDTANPEGGGSERYVETMARGLVERGHTVTIACAAHINAPADEVVSGVRFVRRGDKLGVYLQVFVRLLLRMYGRIDVVVDVQNGLPFFTRWASRSPVVVLVHHVHREQWPVVYPGRLGRVGWWIESVLAPRMYARSQYVAVSDSTRRELVELGVAPDRITIIHNGTEPSPPVVTSRTDSPRLIVLGRLVPHKQVEHAIDAVAALTARHPDLVLDVVGDGWWSEELVAHASQRGVRDRVVFHGFVDHQTKHDLLACAWVMALPSLKEGWGLVVGEAGLHRVPTVAYASAGGTTESIEHKGSGWLSEDLDHFIEDIGHILDDRQLRLHLGDGAWAKAHIYSWNSSQQSFADVIETSRA